MDPKDSVLMRLTCKRVKEFIFPPYILHFFHRSRQGVIRRVIEKQTGKVLAGNFIFCRNKAQKNFFMTEFEILRLNQYDNVLKLHDAFETERSLVLVTELYPLL